MWPCQALDEILLFIPIRNSHQVTFIIYFSHMHMPSKSQYAPSPIVELAADILTTATQTKGVQSEMNGIILPGSS